MKNANQHAQNNEKDMQTPIIHLNVPNIMQRPRARCTIAINSPPLPQFLIVESPMKGWQGWMN